MIICGICLMPLRGYCVNPFKCNTNNHGLHWHCFKTWIEKIRENKRLCNDLACPLCRSKLKRAWKINKNIKINQNTNTTEPTRLWIVPDHCN